jgi:hypothetical protein
MVRQLPGASRIESLTFYVLTWPPEIVEAVRMQPSLTRRRFVGFTVGALTLPGLAGCVRRDHSKTEGTDGMGDRVVFVCRDKSGAFSPGVYLHAGGGGAFDLLRDAAPAMRASEINDAAAALCGHIFGLIGAPAAAAGMLSIFDSPKPDADGKVDWSTHSRGDAGVVVVDLHERTATGYGGYLAGRTVRDLPLADT